MSGQFYVLGEVQLKCDILGYGFELFFKILLAKCRSVHFSGNFYTVQGGY